MENVRLSWWHGGVGGDLGKTDGVILGFSVMVYVNIRKLKQARKSQSYILSYHIKSNRIKRGKKESMTILS